MQSFHNFARCLGIKTTLKEVETFFMGIVRETVQYRETNNVSRNDFMDLLIKIKNSKKVNDTDSESMEGGITMEELAAQVIFVLKFQALGDITRLHIFFNKKVFRLLSCWL